MSSTHLLLCKPERDVHWSWCRVSLGPGTLIKTNSASGHINFVHSVLTEGSSSSTWSWKYRFQKDSCDFYQSLLQKWAVVDTRRSRIMLEGWKQCVLLRVEDSATGKREWTKSWASIKSEESQWENVSVGVIIVASYYIHSGIFILLKIQTTLYIVFPGSISATCLKAELFNELPNSSSATSHDLFLIDPFF